MKTTKPPPDVEFEPGARARLPRLRELRQRVHERERQADQRWQPEGRPVLRQHQQPPAGHWSLWLIEGGRFSGKSFACMVYLARFMRRHAGSRGRIIAPTFADAVASCVEGPSGLLAMDPRITWLPSAPGGAKVVWPNGSEVLLLGTPTPRDVDRLRASGNRHIDVWEEMAANPQLEKAWDQAQFGLRLGEHPHSIASTTPRPTIGYRKIRELPGVTRTHGTMDDNPAATEEWKALMRARYHGTRLGRQEIGGELIEDSDRALVRREWIDSCRVDRAPEGITRLRAVGLDPGGEGSQALVMMGAALDHFLYVERSETVSGSATDFLRHAVRLAAANDAMLIVERNHGGDYLTGLLTSIMNELGMLVPVREVWASVGKRTRAEPVALLIEQGRVKWAGGHSQLEDEWCQTDWEQESPHLCDAMVWAASSLMGSSTVGHEYELQAVPFQ